MPKRTQLVIANSPYQFKNRSLHMGKAYTQQNYRSSTILTDDAFTYIDFYFSSHKKVMKYQNANLRERYGNPDKYNFGFYWKQSMSFYQAAKLLPIESSPLASYYSMLNAVKSLIAFREPYVDNFVESFNRHGLNEDSSSAGEDLETICVKRKQKGVFCLFGDILEENFQTLWPLGTSWSIKKLLYNLAFMHRAFTVTYGSSRGKKVQEQFLPIKAGDSPTYFIGNDGNLYMKAELERGRFSPTATSLPQSLIPTLPDSLTVASGFTVRSKSGAKRNPDSLSTEFKKLNQELRKNFQYIKSTKRLWYLKQVLGTGDSIGMNSMLIIFAAMHRFSEIVRYKPEQLARLLDSKENWLIHEFLTLALDQFIDEIATEITGQDIMCTGIK